MTKFQPAVNLIVVKAVKVQEEVVAESGIILEQKKIIDSSAQAITEGEVISKGPDVKMEANVGDVIFYQTHAAQTFNIRGEDIQVIGEPSVIGTSKKV